MIGTSLGPYRILATLGVGGMGEVYRAIDTRLERHVAIKILPALFLADRERLSRFTREAKLLASVNHARIAAIYSMEVEAGKPFLVLELVEGESLDQCLARGPLPVDKAIRVARQVAEALTAAHDAGIVHRDLKPANVMVSAETLDVKVLDFGIAKATHASGEPNATSGLTKTGTLLGTSPYLSPEQLLDQPVDHRVDIWAFGCLLFEVLTAQRAFARPTVAATLAAVLETEPDWRALPEHTPSRLAELLRRCLCKDPRGRMAHLRDAIIELEGAEAQLSRAAPESRGRLGRQALAGAGLIAATALLYATGLLTGTFARPGAGASGIGYLAVLPFEYQAADRAHEYVAAAMTDQLTTSLGSIDGLRVLGRQSARAYDGSSGSAVEFARRQGLDALVTGAVFRIGQDVRVTVQLLDVRTGDQIWAESYRGTGGEILALSDSTVRSVGRAIGALTAQEAARIAELAPTDPNVLSAYWLGSFYMQDYTEQAMSQAIRAFDQAIALDPGFAPAHAARARAIMLMVQQGFLLASEFHPIARAGMDRALALDPNDPEVLSHDATFRLRTGRDWSGVKEQFETALRLNPNFGEAWHEYSHFLEAIVDTAGAMWAARRYREVEPSTRGPWYHLANLHHNRREWSHVVAVADSGLAVFPNYLPLRVTRASAMVGLGSTIEAISALESVLSVSRDPIAMGSLAVAHAQRGDRQRARELQTELRDLGQWEWVAIIHGALHDLDDAFAAAKQVVDANQGNISFLHVNNDWAPLHVDCGRWQQLLEYAGFAADVIERARSVQSTSPGPGTACWH